MAPLVSGLIGALFGLRHFNLLFGVIFLSYQLGSFAGAWMGGVILDATGSYGFAWTLLVAVSASATALQWPMDQRPPGALRRRRMAGSVRPCWRSFIATRIDRRAGRREGRAR